MVVLGVFYLLLRSLLMPFMMAHDGQEGVLFLPQAFHASTWKSRGSQNSTIPPNETVQVNKDYFDKVVLTKINKTSTSHLPSAPRTALHHLPHHFPSPWKTALVTMIHKPGKDPHNVTSYRPISLLSHIGKLFERILTSRLNNHTESLGLIALHQAGFRKGRATTDNIHRLSEDIHRNFNKKEITLAIFFDIEKTFYKVWHNGPIYRLLDSNLKLPQPTQSIISSFLSNR